MCLSLFRFFVSSPLCLLWIFLIPISVSRDFSRYALCITIHMCIARFVYCYPDVFCLSWSFIAFQVCFVYFDLLSRSSYVLSIAMRIHICSVCHDLLSRYRYVSSIALDLLLRSSYVLSIAMRIHICSVCRDDLSQSRYVSSVALLKSSWYSWLICDSFQ